MILSPVYKTHFEATCWDHHKYPPKRHSSRRNSWRAGLNKIACTRSFRLLPCQVLLLMDSSWRISGRLILEATCRGDGLAVFLERWTGDPKVEGLNPVRSMRKASFSESKRLCWLAVGVPNPRVYTQAYERPCTYFKDYDSEELY